MNIQPKLIYATLFSLLLSACGSKPPSRSEDICKIFAEKTSWHKAAKNMQNQWGTPLYVPMAIMYQESGFRSDAKPPMQYFLGFIPTGRASSAYGFAQAKDEVWSDYKKENNHLWSSRDNFDDAIDFIGWYTNKTAQVNGIYKADAFNQYLNYHEGWGGFKRGTYAKKSWLISTARKVDERAKRYANQYQNCSTL